ncbi:hypothetical protein JAAARDRAFT_38401 [Jaapia argillacea MUCL 33604]|uniref:Uncharacterized protein n=1 Tax=Jaapia argillacea MUCL 33604 TaxID=933084 RepID=A0A067PH43_9AGAM|nr:hypothetical protein JAAARDRAFT_38401 [Jaapia argillacea MUCL 33604]
MFNPDYAITRPYPWRRFGPIFFVASCIVLVLLTLLNAAVAGYETVTVARNDKNGTQQMWWTPLIPRALRATTTCDNYLLSVGDTFITNCSLFQWTLLEAWSEGGSRMETGFQYPEEPMSCGPSSSDSGVDVDINVATVATWTTFGCTTTSGVFYIIQGTWRWSILQSGSSAGGGEHTRLPLSDVLVRLAQDLLEVLLAPPPPGNEELVRLSVQGMPTTFQAKPDPKPLEVSIHGGAVSWANGTSSYRIDNANLDYTTPGFQNFLKALISAGEIDLGVYNEHSIYFSMEMFNATIDPNPLLTGSHFVQSDKGSNLSGAQYLRMYPDRPQRALTTIPIDRKYQLPAIIEVSYLCHELQIKSPLAFISSVFVGTASMFMAFRAFVLLIATVLAKRYSEKANYCEGTLDLEEGRSRVETGHVQEAISSVEVTENDLILEMQPLHDRNVSEATLSAQSATDHLAKGDGARVYDTQENYQWSSELRALLGEET